MTTGPKHRIDTSHAGNRGLVTVSGEIDLASAESLDAALVSENGEALIVDLTHVGFIDSTGVRSLLTANDRIKASGGRLLLVYGEGPVERIIDLTGLADRFEIFPTLEAATAAG